MRLAKKAVNGAVESYFQMTPSIDDEEFSLMLSVLCSSGCT